jgi:hypothetical protein
MELGERKSMEGLMPIAAPKDIAAELWDRPLHIIQIN